MITEPKDEIWKKLRAKKEKSSLTVWSLDHDRLPSTVTLTLTALFTKT